MATTTVVETLQAPPAFDGNTNNVPGPFTKEDKARPQGKEHKAKPTLFKQESSLFDPPGLSPIRKQSTVIDFREPQTPRWKEMEELFVTFCIMHYVPIFWSIFITLYLLWRNGIQLPLIVTASLYIPLYLIPWQRIGGAYWGTLAKRPFWKRLQKHLKCQVEREVELDPSKQYIFPICPHGILLLSRVAIYGGVWEELFPGIEIRTLAASPLFFIPPIREITILLGGVDASRSYAERVLKDGYSLSLYPGGSKEIFTTDPYSPATRLVLQSRRGFIKLALKYGTPLVPVYVFGEKYAYDKLQTTSGISRWLLKTFRIPFLVFWGRWYTMMPKAGTTLSVVVGEPINVPKVAHPSEDLITKYQQKYIEELQELFDRHKDKYAQPGEYLVIE